jgi:hypothetical protein
MVMNLFDGFSNIAAVRAFPIEMFAPVEKVPSRRSKTIRLPSVQPLERLLI